VLHSGGARAKRAHWLPGDRLKKKLSSHLWMSPTNARTNAYATSPASAGRTASGGAFVNPASEEREGARYEKTRPPEKKHKASARGPRSMYGKLFPLSTDEHGKSPRAGRGPS